MRPLDSPELMTGCTLLLYILARVIFVSHADNFLNDISRFWAVKARCQSENKTSLHPLPVNTDSVCVLDLFKQIYLDLFDKIYTLFVRNFNDSTYARFCCSADNRGGI